MAKKITDREAIEAFLADDKKAIRNFYRQMRAYFMKNSGGVISVSGESAEQPEDLFHDALFVLWTNVENGRIFLNGGEVWCEARDGCRGPMRSSLATYIVAVARNKNLEQCRREAPVERKVPLEIVSGVAEDVTDDSYRRQVVDMCIDKLPPACKQILTLFYVDGRSLAEIISIRGMRQTITGLKSSKSKCVARLKQLVLTALA